MIHFGEAEREQTISAAHELAMAAKAAAIKDPREAATLAQVSQALSLVLIADVLLGMTVESSFSALALRTNSVPAERRYDYDY